MFYQSHHHHGHDSFRLHRRRGDAEGPSGTKERSHHGRDGGIGRGRGMGRGAFGRGSGGGRVFGPGDLRLILLFMIQEKPRHGYELIKELEQKFGGGYAPSPGSIYPTLTLLEELEQIRASTSEGTKRLFEITVEGRRFLRDNEAALKSAVSRMEMAARSVSDKSPPPDLHHAMHTLKAALMFHRGDWDAREIARVRKIIEDAAQAILGS